MNSGFAYAMAHGTPKSKKANEQTRKINAPKDGSDKKRTERERESERARQWAKRNAINIFMHGNYSVNRGSYLWLTKSSTSITIIIKQTANDEIYAKNRAERQKG